MKRIYLFFLLCFLCTLSSAQFKDGLLYLKIKDTSSVTLPDYPYEATYPYFDALITEYDITKIEKAFPNWADSVMQKIYKISLDSSSEIDSFLYYLSQFGFVEYVEKEPIYSYFTSPNDPRLPLQYALKRIMADSLWNLIGSDGKIIKIAIIDDAFNIDHEDLDGIMLQGYDEADQDNDPRPPSNVTENYFSHGTHVAGIAGAETNNRKGISSLNLNYKIIIE